MPFRLKTFDLMVLVVFAALGAAGLRLEENVGFFELFAFALAILCAGAVVATRRVFQFRPWIAMAFFWCLWAPLCLNFALEGDLGPPVQVGMLLGAIGAVGSALSAYLTSRFAPGNV